MKIMKMLRGGGGGAEILSVCSRALRNWWATATVLTPDHQSGSFSPGYVQGVPWPQWFPPLSVKSSSLSCTFPWIFVTFLIHYKKRFLFFFYFLFELVDLIFVVNEFYRKVGGRYFVAGGENAGCRHIFTGLNHKHDYRQNWTKWSSVINHNYHKICDVFSPLENKNTKNPRVLLHAWWRVLFNRHDAYCPIALSNW